MTDMIDLTTTPLSMCGSWVSLSRVPGVHGHGHPAPPRGHVRLHTHRHGGHVVAILGLSDGGGDAPTPAFSAVVSADVGAMAWEHLDARMAVAFADENTLRLEGAGAAGVLQWAGEADVEQLSPTSVAVAHLPSRTRWMVASDGELGFDFGGTGARPFARSIRFGSDRPWRAVVQTEDLRHTPAPLSESVADAAAQRTAEFNAFAGALQGGSRLPRGLRSTAAYLLWSAVVHPRDALHRPTVLMSKNWMDKAWSWDTCFNAVGLIGHPRLALDQVMGPLESMDADGMVPDRISDEAPLRLFTKPPLQGWALGHLLDAHGDLLAGGALREVRGLLRRWTRWWLDHDAPPRYLHGFDSGWDNATTFDGGGGVTAPDLLALLAVQLQTEARLAVMAGDERAADDRRRERATLLRALRDDHVSGTRLVARRAGTAASGANAPGAIVAGDSLHPLMGLIAADELPEKVVRASLSRMEKHLGPFGVATEAFDSPAYRPDDYWRGPAWAPACALLVDGIARRSPARAERIAASLVAAASHGFAENWDARTGEQFRDPAYTWTASALLSLDRFLRKPDLLC